MIGFVGLSHLGIVSSLATAAMDFSVIAFDPNSSLCDALNDGDLPVFEPGLPELLSQNRSRIKFTSDPSTLVQCKILFLSVDIPTDEDNDSDLSTLQSLIARVVPFLSSDTTLVILSQVPAGFTRLMEAALKQQCPDRQIFYQVETLVFGRAVERALSPERFIVGCSNAQKELPQGYAEVLSAFGCPVIKMRYESAELAKIAINACLVASIAAANTMAELCEAIGAEWDEIVPALRLDKRIGEHAYLTPGLGIAGGNLERDLATIQALAGAFGTEAGVVDAWLVNSCHRRDWVLRTIHSEVILHHRKPIIAVWGLAYKSGTTSIRNSPALELVESLSAFDIRAYDPQVVLNDRQFPNLIQVSSALEACREADVLAIMTPWDEFSSILPANLCQSMVGRVIIDPFGVLDKLRCSELGIKHFRLGARFKDEE